MVDKTPCCATSIQIPILFFLSYTHEAQDCIFRAIAARHPSFQEAFVLEEVQTPPPLDARVIGGQTLPHCRRGWCFASQTLEKKRV